MRTAAVMLAAVAVVAAVMLAVLRTFDTSDAFPTSAASLPPRLDEAASTPAPAARGADVDIVLSADGVGDLAFGTPMDDAVEQLTEWLGPPSRGPAEYSCEMGGPQVGDVYDWDGFSVSSRDGALEAWVLGNGFGEPPAGLRTDTGIGLGSTVADLQQTFGAQLDLHIEEWPDTPPQPAFATGPTEDPETRRFGGWLTGLEPTDTVESLAAGMVCRA